MSSPLLDWYTGEINVQLSQLCQYFSINLPFWVDTPDITFTCVFEACTMATSSGITDLKRTPHLFLLKSIDP